MQTPRNLFDAIRSHNLLEVKAMVRQGTDVNKKIRQGLPLSFACELNCYDIAEYLLQQGARVERRSTAQITALAEVSMRGLTEMAELLLRWKADVNTTDIGNKTPVFLACQHGHRSTAELLIKHGANVNIASTALYGRTPLMEAIEYGHISCAQLLLKNGADWRVRDVQGNTAKSIAEQTRDQELIALFKGL